MTFLSPSILFGLTATAIPLIIHLLSLRKTKEIDFSSIRFIQELKHESIRRLQLKNWLMVLLRMLIIALLVLMFARPVGEGFISGAMSGEQETRVLILLDNSASMAMEFESESLLENAKKSIPGIVNAYPGQTTIEIWKTCPPQQLFTGYTEDLNVNPVLDDIQSTRSYDNLWTVLDTILSGSKAREPNKECFIFSDFQNAPPSELIALHTDSLDVPWRFYLVSQPEIMHNLSLREVNVISQVRLPDQTMKINTHIENDGNTDMDFVPVELYLDEKRVGQVVSSINKQNGKDFGFEAFPGRTGIVRGKITIPKDDYLLDNYITIDLPIPDQVACTIIGTSTEDTYLIETALHSIDKRREFLLISVKTQSIIDRLSLDETDVLILVNPNQISDQALLQIQSFLTNGGGLIWFMGDNYNSDQESMQYAGLKLPIPTEMVILPGENYLPVLASDINHPLLEGLHVRNFKTELPQVFRYIKVRKNSNQTTVLALSNDDPFLISQHQGNGQLFLFTSIPDLKWNDLPMRGFMVPLLHRMILVLATDETNSTPVRVDDIKRIRLERDLIHSEWRVITPSEKSVLYIPDFNSESLLIDQTEELGSYVVLSDGIPYTAFSTRLHPLEYPSKRISKDIILRQFSHSDIVRWIEPKSDLVNTLQEIRMGKSLWRYFLIAAIVLFIVESLVGRATPDEYRHAGQ